MSGKEDRPLGPLVSGPPAKSPERVTLKGRIVTLVPMDSSHADDLFEVFGGEENAWLWDYLPDGPFPDVQNFREVIERRSKSPDPFFFTIFDNITGKAIGNVSLKEMDLSNRCVETGHVTFSASMQHKSSGTETMYLLTRYAFEDLGYRRYEWKCHYLNTSSWRAALRFGFVFETLCRQQYIRKGRNWDVAWFSILDSEWPTCRYAFEQWLSPNNFDAEGRQKLSLASFRESKTRHAESP